MIRGKIDVRRIRWNEQAVAQQLASEPGIQASLRSKADEVAVEARARVANSAKVPIPKGAKAKSPSGRYYSERPDAVAKMIQVKPAAPLLVFTTARGAAMPVSLVVADHPYSDRYAVAFGSALNAVAGRSGRRWRVQR